MIPVALQMPCRTTANVKNNYLYLSLHKARINKYSVGGTLCDIFLYLSFCISIKLVYISIKYIVRMLVYVFGFL